MSATTSGHESNGPGSYVTFDGGHRRFDTQLSVMSSTRQRLDVTFDREREMLRAVGAFFGRSPHAPGTAATSKAAAYLALLADAYGSLPADIFSESPPLVGALVFDASGLAALACGDPRTRTYLARAVGSLARIVVPATTLLAPRTAAVASAIAEIVAIDESIAHAATRILAESHLALPFDALLVACAASEASAGIVTTDAVGMGKLVRAAARPDLHVFAV